MTLEEVKLYLRIDGDDEDTLVTGLMAAANTFIQNAVGTSVDTTNELYSIAAKMLIAHWYENRGVIGNGDALGFALESILLQLRYTLPDDTTTTTSGGTA